MRYLLVAFALSLALNTGCSKGLPTLTPQMAAKRDLLVLVQEPADSVTVRAARDAVKDNQEAEVIVAGEIGGVADPWDKGHASFMITQVGGPAAAHDHAGHDHGDHDHAHDDHDHADHKHGEEADHKHAEGDHAEHDHAGHAHAEADHAGHDHAGHDHAHAHGDEGHDHDNCPFCQRAKKENLESLAIVQFVDGDGGVLPVDARELFGVREKQKVVVKGRAKIDDLGNLIVSATGIYIQKK